MMKKQPTATQQALIDNGAATRTPYHPLRVHRLVGRADATRNR